MLLLLFFVCIQVNILWQRLWKKSYGPEQINQPELNDFVREVCFSKDMSDEVQENKILDSGTEQWQCLLVGST